MSRRTVLVVLSFALAALLISAVVRIGRVDLRTTVQQVEGVRLMPFCELVLLNLALVFVSSEKWRRIDVVLRNPCDYPQSRFTSFALTSAGLALGILLPAQLAMSTSRTLGMCTHSNPVKRGTAGTLFEQSFDLVAVIFLSVASAVTWLLKGDGVVWAGLALIMTLLALLLVGPLLNPIRFLLSGHWKSKTESRWLGTVLRDLSEMIGSGLLSPSLARHLVFLSAVRFVIVVMILKQTAVAINADIPLWHLAAAQPFVLMASAIVFIAGGIGVNELTLAGCLALFGTPLSTAAQWAMANRVLVTASYLLVAVVSASMLLVIKVTHPADATPAKV